MQKIYIVDDDPDIATIMQKFLEQDGFQVRVFSNATAVLTALEHNWPDLFVLDIMMPGMDGLELCRQIRGLGHVPIIFVSARGEEVDKILGLELGGDDYLTKPFSPRELVARVRTVLRRSGLPKVLPDQFSLGDLTIQQNKRQVMAPGGELNLTLKEFDLFCFLARHQGQALSREQILNAVWGFEYMGDDRAVDDVIKRLRRKMKDKKTQVRISTVWGYGYKIDV